MDFCAIIILVTGILAYFVSKRQGWAIFMMGFGAGLYFGALWANTLLQAAAQGAGR